MKYLLLNIITAIVSLTTATGVLVHDSHFDKALDGHLSSQTDGQPAEFNINGSRRPHTHPEHANGNSPLGNRVQEPNPSYPPRHQRLKRYIAQNVEPRGRHAFDNHHLPVIG